MNTVAVTIDDGNDKADVSGKFHRILEEKVSKNRNKDGEIFHKNIVVHWAKLLWSKKRVYMSLVPHIFDQAVSTVHILLHLNVVYFCMFFNRQILV